MPSLAALLPIQMGRNVASLQNGDKRLNRHQSLKIWADCCWFVNLLFHSVRRRRCCWSFREKVTDEHVCAHRDPRVALKCDSNDEKIREWRRSREKGVRYKWLDFSIWQINRKGDIPFEVGWAKVSTHCTMANVSLDPGVTLPPSPAPKIWTEMTDSTIKW